MALPVRNTLRLPDFDYRGGDYFITLCVNDRHHAFGEVIGSEMECNKLGEFVTRNLIALSTHYPYARCPVFCVMPNHVHAIICIEDIQEEADVRTSLQLCPPKKGTLSVIIRGFKAAITRFAHQQGIVFQWQRDMFEHIIRDSSSMNKIIDYIEHNPAHWAEDRFYHQ